MPSGTLFAKRHYDYLAAWWRTEPLHKPTVRVSLTRFTTGLLRTQRNFNATRFLQACGYSRAEAEAMAEKCHDANRQAKYSTNKVVNTETC